MIDSYLKKKNKSSPRKNASIQFARWENRRWVCNSATQKSKLKQSPSKSTKKWKKFKGSAENMRNQDHFLKIITNI